MYHTLLFLKTKMEERNCYLNPLDPFEQDCLQGEYKVEKNNAELVLKPLFVPLYPELLQKFNFLEASIYGFIKFFLSNNDKFYVSNKQLGLLFNVGEVSISRAIKTLQEQSLIQCKYEIKGGGGKRRYIILYNSDLSKNISQSYTKVYDIENKEIENKEIKENIKRKGYGEFKKCLLSDEEYEKVITDYGLKNGTILINKVDNYCASKGKAYKNYVAAIRNFAKTANINKLPAPIQTNNSIRENDIYLQEFLKCD